MIRPKSRLKKPKKTLVPNEMLAKVNRSINPLGVLNSVDLSGSGKLESILRSTNPLYGGSSQEYSSTDVQQDEDEPSNTENGTNQESYSTATT